MLEKGNNCRFLSRPQHTLTSQDGPKEEGGGRETQLTKKHSTFIATLAVQHK